MAKIEGNPPDPTDSTHANVLGCLSSGIVSLFGGALGVLAVRFLLFDQVQEVGWSLFWDGNMNVDLLLESQGFWLVVMGFLLGAGAANSLYRTFGANSHAGSPEEADAAKKRILVLLSVLAGLVLAILLVFACFMGLFLLL